MTQRTLSILWLKTGPLHPLDSGGKIRTYQMLRELNRRHRVTYLSLCHGDPPPGSDEYADEAIWIPWDEARKGTPEFFVELAQNFFGSTQPYALAKYRSREMARAIRERCGRGDIDLVICDFLFPAVNVSGLELPEGLPVVLFQHNMESQIWKRMAAGKSGVARWYFGVQHRRMWRWEQDLSRLFDGVVAVSEEDAAFARENYGLNNVLGSVPTGVDSEYFAPPEQGGTAEPQTIGFLGSMDWMPNIEAVHHFVAEVLPEIRRSLPDVRLLVIGRNPPVGVRKLAESDPMIEVTGTVDDIRPYLRRCAALVVPLLSGGGTRIKIMEAMAMEVPVVSTSVGAEGLPLVPEEHLLIADGAAPFADAVIRLINDPALCQRLAASGGDLVRQKFGWGGVTEIFERLFDPVLPAVSTRD